jgi:protein gp37
MADKSSIEWTDATWNFVTGCKHISPGCDNCYADALSRRLQAMGVARYRNAFELTIHEDLLDLPRRWRDPRRIFVNSMSDLFHNDVPRHTYQILTKRADRLRHVGRGLAWPPNVWVGVSIENQTYAFRANRLREVPAAVRFLSVEPLLGPVTLDLDGIHWVIVGGESGPHARPMDRAWARSVRDQCRSAGVAFFFKQWGGRTPKAGGRLLDGRTWDQFPSVPTARVVPLRRGGATQMGPAPPPAGKTAASSSGTRSAAGRADFRDLARTRGA